MLSCQKYLNNVVKNDYTDAALIKVTTKKEVWNMTGRTHVTVAVVTGFALGASGATYIPLVIGSLLPDIDHTTSTLGRFFPIGKFIKHRGITHSLLALVASFLIHPWLGLGVLTHILLDMLNPARVQFLYPLKTKVGLGLKFLPTGGIGEKLLYLSTICFFGFLVYQNYGELITSFFNRLQT